MIEAQSVSLLNIKIYDDDIELFTSIIEKLLIEIQKPGFKKTFSKNEMLTIINIADTLGLELPVKANITVSEDLVK